MSLELIAVIPPQTTAANTVINTNKIKSPACLSLIGVIGSTYTINIQIPTTLNPDANTDSNWQNLYQEGAAVTLSSTNHVIAIPVGLSIRIVKPITANNVGVRLS